MLGVACCRLKSYARGVEILLSHFFHGYYGIYHGSNFLFLIFFCVYIILFKVIDMVKEEAKQQSRGRGGGRGGNMILDTHV